jgi:hypothetical protein
MADRPTDDDLTPEQTEGFKVGEKKTLDEYHQLGEAYFFPVLLNPSHRRNGCSQ